MGDRVVLVVVAMGAVEGEAEKGLGRVLDGLAHPLVGIQGVPVPHEIARGDARMVVPGTDLVRRQHFTPHLIVALVRVQAGHDPVPPPEHLRGAVPHVGDVTSPEPVGIAPDIHPVARPAFPVVGRRQEPVHDPRVGRIRGIGEERVQLVARGRVTHEVDVHAAQEDLRRGGADGLQPACVAFGGNEGIDRVAVGSGGMRWGQAGADGPLEGPVFPGVGLGHLIGWRGHALGDPLAQGRHLLGRQRPAVGRHPFVRVVGGHAREQWGGFRVRGIGDDALVGALAEEVGGVEAQPALLAEGSVA